MPPLLFRLLLCATLLLNGIGSAVASAHVALAVPPDVVEPSAAPTDADCPHAQGTGHAVPDEPAAPAATDCMTLCLELSLHATQALPPVHAAALQPVMRVALATRIPPRPLPGPRPPPVRPPIPA